MFLSPVAALEFSRAAMCNLLLKTQTIYTAVQSSRYIRLYRVIPKCILSCFLFCFVCLLSSRAWFHKATGWVLSFSEAPAQPTGSQLVNDGGWWVAVLEDSPSLFLYWDIFDPVTPTLSPQTPGPGYI